MARIKGPHKVYRYSDALGPSRSLRSLGAREHRRWVSWARLSGDWHWLSQWRIL